MRLPDQLPVNLSVFVCTSSRRHRHRHRPRLGLHRLGRGPVAVRRSAYDVVEFWVLNRSSMLCDLGIFVVNSSCVQSAGDADPAFDDRIRSKVSLPNQSFSPV